MLIVKGARGKSVLAQILTHYTESICFEYYDYPVMYNSYCVDSEVYSLPEFAEYVEEELRRLNAHDRHYDYLIIYTNEKEEDLKGLIEWLDENKFGISCKDIIVMCRE